MRLGITLLGLSALLGAALSGTISKRSDDPRVVMCYFEGWAVYRNGDGKYDVEDIDPFLCTHLQFGFAGIDPVNYTIKSLDPWNDLYDNWGKGAYDRFTRLKLYNPNLKTLLAIGGWNEGSINYSDMVSVPERRTKFIDSVVELLLKHKFDGLDMDWEYPGGRPDSGGKPEDRANYAALLREMRARFDEHGLLITAAVGAYYTFLEEAYDVAALTETLDFINLMTYDFHGWWDDHHYTGHNSPLYSRPEEMNEDSPGYRRNSNDTVHTWLEHGARPEQLLMGLASFGHGFVLSNQANNGLYEEARGGNPAGPYTQAAGYWGYNEVCEKVLLSTDWTTVRDEHIGAPYVYKDDVWFGYDDEESIRLKSQYIIEMGLGGAMFWAIDTDDFKGKCGEPNGLILAAAEELNGGKQTAPPDWTTPDPNETTTTPEPDTPPPSDKCDGTPGPKPDPDNCHDYYTCTPTNGGWLVQEYTCGELAFNPESGVCDWPYNVPGCEDQETTPSDGTTNDPAPNDHCSPGDPMLAVDGDCGSFLECDPNDDGSYSYQAKQCEEGLAFNPELQICDWPYNVPGCQ